MSRSRRLSLAFASAAALGVVFLVVPTSISAADQSVSIVDFRFQARALTITVGSTVTWTNTAGRTHTVTSDDGSFDSGNLAPNDAFANVFDTPGTFTYECTIHPRMTGTIVVKAGAATPVPSGSPAPTPPPGTLPPGFSPGAGATASPSAVPTASPVASPTEAGSSPAPAPGPENQAGPLGAVALIVLLVALVVAILMARSARSRRS